MRKTLFLCLAALAVLFCVGTVAVGAQKCATIQSGTLVDAKGITLTLGYDMWGYNYQAHMFNGLYENYTRPLPVFTESDTNLAMKWNDAWLSNQDCDGDGKLDRHYGFPTYVGSGAWLTNHMSGVYELYGQLIHWTYFVKIVAAPADAVKVGGMWFTADGVEIGPVIWGEFAILQEVSNDPGADQHGLQYKSPAAPGFGKYQP